MLTVGSASGSVRNVVKGQRGLNARNVPRLMEVVGEHVHKIQNGVMIVVMIGIETGIQEIHVTGGMIVQGLGVKGPGIVPRRKMAMARGEVCSLLVDVERGIPVRRLGGKLRRMSGIFVGMMTGRKSVVGKGEKGKVVMVIVEHHHVLKNVSFFFFFFVIFVCFSCETNNFLCFSLFLCSTGTCR